MNNKKRKLSGSKVGGIKMKKIEKKKHFAIEEKHIFFTALF
jgi:hypothetical protein